MTDMGARLLELSKASDTDDGWSPPGRFNLSDGADVDRLHDLIDSGAVRSVKDPIAHIADEMYDVSHPNARDDASKRGKFITSILERGERFGEWFYFPWNETLVRYPDEGIHQTLRTSRNRNLFDASEHDAMYHTNIAVFGLSVGSNVVEQMVQAGVGNRYMLGDMDTISPTNLNRIRSNMGMVGLKKVHAAARYVSETSPYIGQVHLLDGYDEDGERALDAFEPDIIVDEVDDVVAKARLRDYAMRAGVPVVMAGDMDDKAIVDIERYDIPSERTIPFNGRITQELFNQLVQGELTQGERQRALAKIAGIRYLTPRLMQSIMERDDTLTGIPQLGTTAAVGAAMVTSVARDIAAKRPVGSGTHSVPMRRNLDLAPGVKPIESARTYLEFMKYVHSLK